MSVNMWGGLETRRWEYARPEVEVVAALNKIFAREGIDAVASTLRDAPTEQPSSPQIVVNAVNILPVTSATRDTTLAAALFCSSLDGLEELSRVIEALLPSVALESNSLAFVKVVESFSIEERDNGRFIAAVIIRGVQKGTPTN